MSTSVSRALSPAAPRWLVSQYGRHDAGAGTSKLLDSASATSLAGVLAQHQAHYSLVQAVGFGDVLGVVAGRPLAAGVGALAEGGRQPERDEQGHGFASASLATLDRTE